MKILLRLVSLTLLVMVVKALELFDRASVGRLPVVDEHGKLLGMLTKGNITNGTLRALQKDYQEEEVRRYRASHLFEDIISERTTLVLRYTIKAGDFTQGGKASSYIKRALLRLGVTSPLESMYFSSEAKSCRPASISAPMPVSQEL